MAESTDVNLPRTHPAVFPDRCVVCLRDEPNSKVRLVTSSLGWLTILTWFWGTPCIVKAPACFKCGIWLHAVRVLSMIMTIVSLVVAFWLFGPTVKEIVAPAFYKWAMLGLGLVSLLPNIIFAMFMAPPFDVTVFDASIDYEFTSKQYASDFAMRNMDAEWVKINGETVNGSSDTSANDTEG